MSINAELKEIGLTGRKCLLVYLVNARDQYKLRRYGDIVYFSKKMGYCVIYVDDQDITRLKNEISHLNFVKKVDLSADDEIDLSSDHIEGQISQMAKEAEEKLENQSEDPFN